MSRCDERTAGGLRPSRRMFLGSFGTLTAWAGTPRIGFAADRDPRLLVIILRGALDGLTRKSHKLRCIGALTGSKLLCCNDLAQARGDPRCPHGVVRPGWRSEERVGATWLLPSMVGL